MRKPTIYFGIDYKLNKGENAGKYHLRMWITFKDDNWNQVPYKTGVFCSESEFKILNDRNKKKCPAVLQERQDTLDKIEMKAKTIIEEYGISTQAKFEAYFLSKYPIDSVALEFEKKIEELEKKEKFSSAGTYGNAMRSLQAFFGEQRKAELRDKELEALRQTFDKSHANDYNSFEQYLGKDFTFAEVTGDRLREYEEWFINQKRSPKNENDHRKKSLTTVGIYLRPLRHLFKRKIKAGILPEKAYPFGLYEDKYIIPEGGSEVDNLLVKEDIDKFMNWTHPTDENTIARIVRANLKPFTVSAKSAHEDFDTLPETAKATILKSYALGVIEDRNRHHAYAKFIYYANGKNLNDLARLKKEKVFKEYLTVRRQKTDSRTRKKQPIVIPRHPVMDEIINKYGKRSLVPDDYVFPILDLSMTEEQRYNAIKSLITKVNKVLARITKDLGFDIKVKSYTMRHSYSFQFLQLEGASVALLSKMLGHASEKTTEHYTHRLRLDRLKKFSQGL